MALPSIAPHCPWHALSEMAKPNVKWCEAMTCSWITEPANTWSNLAFILAGIIIWRDSKKNNLETIKLLGPTVIMMGLFSFIYHASYTFYLQIFDFIGMFAFIGILLLFNLRRMGVISKDRQVPLFIGGVTFCTALFLFFYWVNIPMQIIVAVLVVGVVASEIMARKNANTKPVITEFVKAMACLGVALTFTLLDVTRIWCNPQNHWIQGHAIWHIFNAATVYFCYKYYKQFSLDGETTSNFSNEKLATENI